MNVYCWHKHSHVKDTSTTDSWENDNTPTTKPPPPFSGETQSDGKAFHGPGVNKMLLVYAEIAHHSCLLTSTLCLWPEGCSSMELASFSAVCNYPASLYVITPPSCSAVCNNQAPCWTVYNSYATLLGCCLSVSEGLS